MQEHTASPVRPQPTLSDSVDVTLEELQLATRNHGMPLEALRYPVTPVGLHYVLTHYDIPSVDVAGWRLRVGGLVRRELALSLDDIRARPSVRMRVTMECAGNGRALLAPRPISQPWLAEAVGTGEWGGTPLRLLLEEAEVDGAAVEVLFAGLDRGMEGEEEQSYERSLPVGEAHRDEVLLAYELNGQPLPPQHGFPLRLVVPGWYGMASVKWLERITVLDRPFDGYQQQRSYRLRQAEGEEGEPLTRMLPRALMVPPGIPEFLTRERLVELGRCQLEGRAWSGSGPVTRVQVSTDGGTSWDDAEVESPATPWSWAAWRYLWEPEAPGRYELMCRARDAAGNEQPVDPPWNLGGYANNAAQRIAVTVR
jgi:DMSO/TMAO reductase YedYZ molybdopterin-dependent catalytic subunit